MAVESEIHSKNAKELVISSETTETEIVVMDENILLLLESSKISKRKKGFEVVKSLLKDNENFGNELENLCHVLINSIPMYLDRPSQYLLQSTLVCLIRKVDQKLKSLIGNLYSKQAHNYLNTSATSSLNRYHIFHFEIGCHIWDYLGKSEMLFEEDALHLVDALSIYFYLSVDMKSKKNMNRLKNAFELIAIENRNKLTLCTAFTDENLPYQKMIFGSWCLDKLVGTNKPLINEVKISLIKSYVKNVLLSKKKPEKHLLELSGILLKQISSEQFKEHLMPVTLKSLLRNPEIVLEAVGLLFSHLEFDLSSFVEDYLKVLQNCLQANEDKIREEAIFMCEQLSRNCTEPNAIKCLIKFIFDIINGVHGKVTVSAHKISLLIALEKVCYHKVDIKFSSELSEDVTIKLVKILETESHEMTLIQCLSTLNAWSLKLDNKLPEKMVTFLPKGLGLKSSSTSVKASYFKYIFSCTNEFTADRLIGLVECSSKMLEKAISQSAQISFLKEALAICNFLFKISTFAPATTVKVHPIIFSVLDKKKSYFTSEKFLSQASPETLILLVTLSEMILLDPVMNTRPELDQIRLSLAWCLCCSHRTVRLSAQKTVKELASVNDAATKLCDLLPFIEKILYTFKVPKQKQENNEIFGELLPVGVIQALLLICSQNVFSKEQKKNLILLLVKTIFHHSIQSQQYDLWWTLCQSLDLNSSSLISQNKEVFLNMIHENLNTPDLLSGIFLYGGHILFDNLVPEISESLDDEKLIEISDHEMKIYSTPEGVLFNQEVVDQAIEKELEIKNVKKSNKVYSHAEQIMMLEEKKKEFQKKRKEGKLELTPKQKEIMKTELEKESLVRKKVAELEVKCSKSIILLKAAVKGNLKQLSFHFKYLIPIIIKYLSSKLVGHRLSEVFFDMRKVFDNDLFSSVLSRCTLKAYDTAMNFPFDWMIYDLNVTSYKVLENIYNMTSVNSDSEENYFTASSFVYCYFLLEWMIKKWSGEQVKRDKITTWVVSVIKTHVKMRGLNPNSLYHPKILPRENILKLLITIVSTNEGRTQQNACAVLQDLCVCASGIPGCDRASKDEICILLDSLMASVHSVRDASLRGLNVLIDSRDNLSLKGESWRMMTHRLWVTKHDKDDSIQSLANELWDKGGMKCDKSMLEEILNYISHNSAPVREAAASALTSIVLEQGMSVDKTNQKLIQIYKKKLEMTPAKKDQYEHIIAEAIDHWEGRAGVALAILGLVPHLQEKGVVTLARFFVSDGLGDRDVTVRKHMLEAGLAMINHHGKDTVNSLLPVFEKFLNSAPNQAKYDAVRQNVIILMGSLAKHLDQTDPKIQPIVKKLIDALNTPSQQVQESVANCLYPLIPAVKEDCPAIVSKLMKVLFESTNYGQRKGAAYGIASIVKGLGILSLKQLDIMNQLNTAIQEKKIYKYKEGSLFALEQLCNMLGKLFEPYIVHILPHLLSCFGDGNTYVRDAADDTARAVMSKLSAHGVKLVLPSLLAALEEDSWRTKTGSVELLGNMAFCAPKQLSSCLPSIVPRLIDILSDSHQKVQEAGGEALKVIGSVIRNPEIQAIVPVLLSALQQPGQNTSICLQTLLETKFVHFIDAPSLALIMPVVQRAFQDRSTEVRKMAAQIIGNMYSLTDQKDLSPYLPNVIPGLKASLLDPVPKVRSVSARALGAMVKGMGESSFDDLLPWLMQTLTTEASPVDRSGAAQGLAEVVGGLGTEKLHRLMPDIVSTAERSDIAPHVKDGYIMMFIFLPTVFEEEFTPYIGQIIPPILKALSDENEFVRDTALRAGQRIVNTYAQSAVTLLLPELENGLFNDNWRIRFSSVQLLGDLLYRVSGVSGKMTTDTVHEDDNFGTESSQKAMMKVLGEERRNRVLAGLYMGRSDVALMVRQASLHVWKIVVTNTPKTLREILPTLFSLLLSCLASTSYDKRQVAARTLGDLVRKLGERVLPEIIPILEDGLDSPDPDHRQGVCIGLSEIMASTSKDMILCFTDNLVPTVRRALCDPLPTVREAAAHTFDSLHATVGLRALEDILPALVLKMKDPEQKENALDGLKQVMIIKSRVVLPYLIPKLTAPPVNTEALCVLASVAGESLTRHLNKILPPILNTLAESVDTEKYDQIIIEAQDVVLAVNDEVGVSTLIDELLTHSKSKSPENCRAAISLLMAFCSNTKVNYTDYAPQLIRGFIQLFVSSDKITVQSSWEALSAVTKSLDPADQRALVSDVRQAVRFAASDLKGDTLMPGFCLTKGIQPVLPIFREAILNGEPEQKEAAANGLTEVIRLTSATALKSSVVHVTGPLIRILGDRFNWNVKVAVLDTLALLLEKAGVMLKPFLPQLQTTFVKAIHDSHRLVRLKAGYALSKLIAIHTRPDPLYTELINSVKSAEDQMTRETMLQALRAIVKPGGSKMSEAIKKSLISTITQFLHCDADSIRLCSAGVLGVLLPSLNDSEAQSLISTYVIGNAVSDVRISHGQSSALFCCLKSDPEKLFQFTTEEKVCKVLLNYISSDVVIIVKNGVVGTTYLFRYLLENDKPVPGNILTTFSKIINHPNNEIKQSMCRTCQYVSEKLRFQDPPKVLPPEFAKPLLPMLMNGTKEKNPVVKSAAEMALIAVLGLKEKVDNSQALLSVLESGTKDALDETIAKMLRKASYSMVTENEIDPSILT